MSDIELGVRKYLLEKAAQSQQTFLPFRVERVVEYSPAGTIRDWRQMYRPARGAGRHLKGYMRPLRSTDARRTMSQTMKDRPSAPGTAYLLDGAMLQTFYADRVFGDASGRRHSRVEATKKGSLPAPERSSLQALVEAI